MDQNDQYEQRQGAILERLATDYPSAFRHADVTRGPHDPTEHAHRPHARTPGSHGAVFVNPADIGLTVIETTINQGPSVCLAVGIKVERIVATERVDDEILQSWITRSKDGVQLHERRETSFGWITEDGWVPAPTPDRLQAIIAMGKTAAPYNGRWNEERIAAGEVLQTALNVLDSTLDTGNRTRIHVAAVQVRGAREATRRIKHREDTTLRHGAMPITE